METRGFDKCDGEPTSHIELCSGKSFVAEWFSMNRKKKVYVVLQRINSLAACKY
jgi:hypothetical protein